MKLSFGLTVIELEHLARKIRFSTIRNSYLTGTPHLGSCLSCADLLVWLYWNVLNIDANDLQSPERDRFILSKGHAAPILFQVLAQRGFFPSSKLESYGQNGSVFGEHPPAPHYLAGIEAATGSLGHGLSMGLGMALAARIQRLSYKVFVILGDGECNEGSVWESALMAGAQKVKNLTIFVDYNKWQATGRSDEVLGIAPLSEKWKAFGWASVVINGHSFEEMAKAIELLESDPRPKAIIAGTVKGKGISFMEDDNNWHYRIPTAEEVQYCAKSLQISEDQIQIEGMVPIRHD